MASVQQSQQKLEQHLHALQQDPTKPLDVALLQSYELSLDAPGAQQNAQALQQTFYAIAQVLPTLQQDPTALVKLCAKVAAPLSYDHIAALDLLPGLALNAVPFHDLILSLLDKAANANDTVRLAAQPDLIRSLVILWLCTPNIATSEQAGELLYRYLKVSKNRPASLDIDNAPKYGEGPMWKRLFGDKDIYELFFGICSLDAKVRLLDISKNDRTLAQSRLMDWLPRVGALDWNSILKSQHLTVSQKYGLQSEEGLLPFAARKMVDAGNDILMHIRILEFYKQLLETIQQPSANPNMSVSLDYLIHTDGIHERAVSYWLKPELHDSLDSSFLSKPSAQYVGAWAATHPLTFAYGSNVADVLRDRLNANLNQLSPTQWARGLSPENDLLVLANLPPTFFVDITAPTPEKYSGYPLSRIPSKFTNADALNTLAKIFRNSRNREEIVFPMKNLTLREPSEGLSVLRQQAARGTFLLYLSASPTFFSDLINHAEIFAMKDVALASLGLLRSIATADWTTPTGPAPNVEQFVELVDMLRLPIICSLIQRSSQESTQPLPLPAKGIQVLACKAFRGAFFSWLLKPATVLPNSVGGRGDTEKAAYQIAAEKFDLVKDVHAELAEELKAQTEDTSLKKDMESMERTLKRRIAEGVFGKREVIGGQVATMQGA